MSYISSNAVGIYLLAVDTRVAKSWYPGYPGYREIFPKTKDDLYIISSNIVHLGKTFVLQY